MSEQNSPSSQLASKEHNRKLAAYSLASGALVSILMMLHHPSTSSSVAAEQVMEVAHHAGINALVHGILIVLILLFCGCLTVYSMLRGLYRVPVLFALISYFAGSLAMIGAALISGFIFPEIASTFEDAGSAELLTFMSLRQLCWFANQALANFGTFCWLLSLLLWSLDLVKTPQPIKIIGIVGILVSILAALTLLTGIMRLDVSGMTAVTIILSAWYLMIAYLLLADRLE
ncbi:MAG: hypothetical protein HKN85_06830 [Gammaproteobacteria bacterium]|nr:hypothetical protein [Gammaproteobacteria bacterium]